MNRFKIETTKKLHDQLSVLDFNGVTVSLKALGCTISLDCEDEKDHHFIIEMEIPEENQMNIDNLATQTPEEKEELDAVDFSRACEIGRSKLKSNPVIQLSIDELGKFDDEPDSAFASINDAIDACEWSNGDKCSFDNRTGVFIGLSKNPRLAVVEIDNDQMPHDIDLVKICDLSKPETPQQREERERLEAAYDLYLAFWSASKSSIILESFKEFSWGGNSDLKHFLAVVDKTGHRKESN